ncbi:MAG: 3-oxoadipate enol-lactonase [Bryobacterales bacterium]|nr:3-oxoadipate enol-lactonase [Bryobacterales bacterium]
MAFAALSDVTLHYRLDGPEGAPRVVLLNSLGTDWRIWGALVDRIGASYRCLRYDQRGQGLSDTPPGPYSVGDHATDLLALLRRLDWRPSVLCGLSIGGMIAMEIAGRRPDVALGLVLADTATVIGPREFWESRMRQVRDQGLHAIAAEVMRRWFGGSYLRDRPADAHGWSNLLARAPLEGYLGSCAALRDADLGQIAGSIAAPSVCVCGSEDQSTPPAAVRDLAAALPDAAYVELAGAGHLTPVEQPDQFAGVLRSFMEGRLGG